MMLSSLFNGDQVQVRISLSLSLCLHAPSAPVRHAKTARRLMHPCQHHCVAPSEMIARQRNGRDRDSGDSRGRFSRYEPRGRGSFHQDDYQRRRSPPRRDRFEPRGDRFNDRHVERERRNDRYEPVRDRSPIARDRFAERYERAPRQRDHLSSSDRNGDRADRAPPPPPPRDREEPERLRSDRYAPLDESDELHESRGRDRRY